MLFFLKKKLTLAANAGALLMSRYLHSTYILRIGRGVFEKSQKASKTVKKSNI